MSTFPNLEAEQSRHGYTDEDMSKRIGIKAVTYNAKKKSGAFKLPEIKIICEVFNCNFDYLFANEPIDKTESA